MHRNTFIFIIFLAVISAIIAGINISNRLHPAPEPTPAPSVSVTPSPIVSSETTNTSERKQILTYTNTYCGISVAFDSSSLKFQEEASHSAIFMNLTDPNDSVVLGCQKDIPRPALSLSAMETRTVASISGTLYHDSSSKDGTKIDAVIFTHPKNKLDIYIAGYGKTFEDLLTSITTL